jgi:hypothetical protein
MRLKILTMMVLAAVVSAGSAHAGVRSGIDVPVLVDSSDLIVVGRVHETHFDGPAATPNENFTVSVERVLKGAAKAVQVRLDLSDSEAAPVAERQYGIFFLKSVGGGSLIPTDPSRPALVASPVHQAILSVTPDPLSRVAHELTEVLATSYIALADPDVGVQHLASRVELPEEGLFASPGTALRVLQGRSVQGQIVYGDAADALKTIPYDIVAEPLRSLARSEAVLTRLWAVDCLVVLGDTEFLAAVKPVLLNPPADIDYTTALLANAMEGRFVSPALVPVLADLLSSKSVAIRRAAAHELKSIGNSDVVAPLGVIALRDTDREVRFHAVGGLARATGIRKAPSIADFGRNESEATNFWNGWVAANAR